MTFTAIETGRGLTLERVDDPALAFRHWDTTHEDPRFDAAPAECRWQIARGTDHGWLRDAEGACRGFALVGEDGRAHLVPGLREGRVTAMSVSPAGALVAWQPDPADRRTRRLYRVALDAEPVAVWTAEADIRAIARVADGWLVATLDQLVVLREDGPRLAIASERRGKPAAWLAPARGGTCVLVGHERDTEIWGYHDGAITQLDALGTRFGCPREIDGKLIFWAGTDTFELRGLDALLEVWQAKRKPARKAAKRSATALTLERSDAPLEPVRWALAMHELADEAKAPYAEVERARVFQSPASQRTVAIDDGSPGAVLWRDASGAVMREPGSWGTAAVAFSPNGDEAIAYQAGFALLVHVDLAAGLATRHPLTVDRKEVRDAAALGNGLVLVVLAKVLALRGATGVRSELAIAKCTKVHAVRDDLAIVTCDATGKKTRVVAIVGDQLVELGAFPERFVAVGRIGDDIAIETIDGDRMILRGIAEALAQFAPPAPQNN